MAVLGNCSVKVRRSCSSLADSNCRGEPADGFGEDVGVDLLAVAGDEGVGELVDEAHGEEGAGVEGGGRIGVGARPSLSAAARLAAGGYVGEDDVAGVAEEQVVDLGRFADGAGDVEFHLGRLRALQEVSRLREGMGNWMRVGRRLPCS
jgi:hypothetical protein